MRRLRREEVVTIEVLKDAGQANSAIARTLGVTEGAVRHHLRRRGGGDGRQHKPRKAAAGAAAIQHWVQAARGDDPQARPVSVRALYEWLVLEQGYDGSYKSVLRYVRAHFPRPKLRPFRRVETPPGAQAQVDC